MFVAHFSFICDVCVCVCAAVHCGKSKTVFLPSILRSILFCTVISCAKPFILLLEWIYFARAIFGKTERIFGFGTKFTDFNLCPWSRFTFCVYYSMLADWWTKQYSERIKTSTSGTVAVFLVLYGWFRQLFSYNRLKNEGTSSSKIWKEQIEWIFGWAKSTQLHTECN